jgi:hypothetical protein
MARKSGKDEKLTVNRELAMNARPTLSGIVRNSATENGELRLTAHYTRPRWQRLLGADEKGTRTFVLDKLGREVYEACDGQRRVRDLVSKFAQKHRVSLAEAEHSVTTYLRTLLTKGLLVMKMEKQRK